MNDAAKFEILIDVQAKLAELLRTRSEFTAAKKEAQGFGEILRNGLGIGTGMEIARRGIELVKGAISASVNEAFRMAGQLKDVSQNLSITTEALQVLTEHVKDNGGEFETFTQAVVSFQAALAQARTGSEAAAKTFRELGLSADDLSRLPLEQQLEKVAKAINRADNAGGAFDQAVQLLGTRNAPKLMQSLRELADQGYAHLAKSMKDSGRVMSDDTIDRLDAAQKSLERMRRSMTITAGETVAAVDAVNKSLKKDFWGTAWAGLKLGIFGPAGTGDFGATVMQNQPPVKNEAPVPTGPKMASEEAVNLARILSLQQSIDAVESNQLITETERRRQLLVLLGQQAQFYHEIEKAKFSDAPRLVAKAALGTLTEEELARYKEYIDLLGKEAAIRNQRAGLASPKSDYQTTKEGFDVFASGKNANGGNLLSPGEGVGAGLMQWATQVGSVGQQIATTINGTIGSAVNNLSDGIMGVITRTKSLGDVFSDIGRLIVQQLIAMVVQALVFAAVMTVINVLTGGTASFGASFVGALSGKRDSGGEVTPGRPYIVGENRPEVFVPSSAGRIVPNAESFTRRSPGLGASAPVAATKPRLYLMRPDTQQQFDAMRRLPEWDVHVVDTVQRHKGTLLNS